MPSYVRQKSVRDYDCGPVAIYNALKWAGAKLRHSEAAPFIDYACRIHNDDEGGTLDHDFDRTLRYTGQALLRIRKPKALTMRELRRHLAAGGAAAVGYVSRSAAHFTLLIGVSGRGFLAVNDTRADKARTVSYKRRATVADWVRGQRHGNSFWLLTKLTRSDDNRRDAKAEARKERSKGKPRGLQTPGARALFYGQRAEGRAPRRRRARHAPRRPRAQRP